MQEIGNYLIKQFEHPYKKRTRRNENSLLIEQLKAKPVAFNPLLAKIADSAIAGLFLSQLLYWSGKGWDKEWVYKTIEECKKETCLSRSEQDRAIKKWKELGVLEVENRGLPMKRHFHINGNNLMLLLEKNRENSELSMPKRETRLQD